MKIFLFSFLFPLILLAANTPCENKDDVLLAALSASPSASGKTPEERKTSQAKAVLDWLDKAPKDAKLLVLPEAVLTPLPEGDSGDFSSVAEARKFAVEVPGVHRIPEGDPLRKFAEAAFNRQAFIHVGMIEKEGEKLYNTVVVIGPDRKIHAKHRKVNLSFAIGSSESKYITPGPHRTTLYDGSSLGLGNVGVAICADIYDSTQSPHLMEKYRTSPLNTLGVSAEWMEKEDSEEGPTKGWPPERFFKEVTQYVNHPENIPADRRYKTPKKLRTDQATHVVFSNSVDPAPWSGIMGPDGSPLASRKDSGWVSRCVPRVRPKGTSSPAKPSH